MPPVGRFRIRPRTIMQLTDIHTHNRYATAAIFNSPHYCADRIISLGIHPWDIDSDWRERFRTIEETAKHSNVVAIGECGIDKMKSTASIDIQTEAFIAHALLAEKLHKPLIIHCVRAYDEILSAHKKISPQQTWIVHGFRGKPQLATQLVNNGLCISLGEQFNPESAASIPGERLFVESDKSRMPLDEIYARIAAARKQPIETMTAQISGNADRCGFAF